MFNSDRMLRACIRSRRNTPPNTGRASRHRQCIVLYHGAIIQCKHRLVNSIQAFSSKPPINVPLFCESLPNYCILLPSFAPVLSLTSIIQKESALEILLQGRSPFIFILRYAFFDVPIFDSSDHELKLIRDAELTAQIAVFPALIVHHALDGQQRIALYHIQILGLLMVRKHDLKDFI